MSLHYFLERKQRHFQSLEKPLIYLNTLALFPGSYCTKKTICDKKLGRSLGTRLTHIFCCTCWVLALQWCWVYMYHMQPISFQLARYFKWKTSGGRSWNQTPDTWYELCLTLCVVLLVWRASSGSPRVSCSSPASTYPFSPPQPPLPWRWHCREGGRVEGVEESGEKCVCTFCCLWH